MAILLLADTCAVFLAPKFVGQTLLRLAFANAGDWIPEVVSWAVENGLAYAFADLRVPVEVSRAVLRRTLTITGFDVPEPAVMAGLRLTKTLAEIGIEIESNRAENLTTKAGALILVPNKSCWTFLGLAHTITFCEAPNLSGWALFRHTDAAACLEAPYLSSWTLFFFTNATTLNWVPEKSDRTLLRLALTPTR